MRRLLPLFFVLTTTTLVLGHGPGPDATGSLATAAQGTSQAGVVVDLGNGDVKTACVTFTSASISGVEALQRAGMQPGLFASGPGTAICSLCGQGCPSDATCLTCGGRDYWAYHRSPAGTSGWSYSPVGAGGTRVGHGDVEGWRWGPGAKPQYRSFASICGAQAPESPPKAVPTTAPVAAPNADPGQASPAPGQGAGSGSSGSAGSSSSGPGSDDRGAASSSATGAAGSQDPTSQVAEVTGSETEASAAAGDGAAPDASDTATASANQADGSLPPSAEDGETGSGEGVDAAAATGSSSDGGVSSIVLFAVTMVALGGVGSWIWRRNRRGV